MNTAASTMAGGVLNGVVDNMNNNVRTQLLQGFEKQGATLTAKQAASLATWVSFYFSCDCSCIFSNESSAPFLYNESQTPTF
jgi:hypothetical protein